jgi:hypothetical protein
VGVPGPTGPAGGVPTFGAGVITGTVVPDGDFVGGTSENGYTGGGSAYGTTTVQWNQYFFDYGTQAIGVKGLAFIQATFRSVYNGNVKVFLPQVTPEGAKVNWSLVQRGLPGVDQRIVRREHVPWISGAGEYGAGGAGAAEQRSVQRARVGGDAAEGLRYLRRGSVDSLSKPINQQTGWPMAIANLPMMLPLRFVPLR